MTRALSGQRVLVVEDELLVSWVAHDMLAELGCIVVGPAGSVSQALAIVAAQPVDAALLDINLEGQLSYPVADALALRGVPYVFVSGYDVDQIPQAYRAAPSIQKPLRAGELASALADLLQHPAPEVAPEDSRAAPRP